MKKVFALVLVVCMMLCTAAFAEYDMILQDELPPAVVTSVNEVGETVAAKIFDAEGNAISEILDDGTVTLVDVYGRKDDHGADSISRLTAAYEGIMAQIHFSDEPCSQHEHEIRVDIDEALAALDKDIDAYDLVMYELFDILDNDSIDALLTDGSYMELTLEVAEYQTAPIVALFTADGEEWEVLPTYAVNGRRFTVRLAETGAIALLQDGYELIGLGKDYEEIVIAPEEGDGDENVNENFTPSVSGKSAPQLNSFEGDDGETYIGRMYDAENDEYISVPDKNYVLITAVAERDYIADIQTHEHLAWAYNGVLEAEDVGELHTVCADDTAAEAEVLSVALDQGYV